MLVYLRVVLAGSAVVAAAMFACGGSTEDGGGDTPDASVDTSRPRPVDAAEEPDPNGDPRVDSILVADESGAEVQMGVSAAGRIVVSWIGTGAAVAIRYAVSDDQGATFTPAQQVGSTVGDPIVAALDDGAFLLGGLRAKCTGGAICSDGEIFLGRLPAGANALESLPSVYENDKLFIDHPWMSVRGKTVSMIGAVFSQDGGVDRAGMTTWRSSDRGDTWQRSELVALDTNIIGVPRFCSGTGQRLWAHYYDGASLTSGTLRWQDDAADGGWAPSDTTTAGDTSGLFTTGACTVKDDTVYMIIGAVAPGGGAEQETALYADLHVVISNDLGATWTEGAVIQQAGSKYLLPEVNVEPDGTLDVFAYRGEDEGGDAVAELVRVRNGGKTAEAPIPLRKGLVLEPNRASQRWLGDYNGVGFSNGKPIFAFGDNTTLRTKVRFARLK